MPSVHLSPQDIWQDVTKDYPREACNRWWDVVSGRYAEPHRHYHTMAHITHMLNLAQEHRMRLRDFPLVCLAIIFHDIVYNPQAGDNEEQSAELFRRFSKDVKLQEERAQKGYDWIVATKTHSTIAHTSVSNPGTLDIHYLLDFDMSCIGFSLGDYLSQGSEIRREYCHLSDEEWTKGRIKFLGSLQKIPFIFATAIFRESHESQAETNIQYDLEILRQGQS